MEDLLRVAATALGIIFAAGILLAGGWQLWLSWRRRAFEKKQKLCAEIIANAAKLPAQDLLPLILQLKQNFLLEIVEAVLDKIFASSPPQERRNLRHVYDHLGLLKRYLEQVRSDKSWLIRARFAQKLGQLGHPNAVLPLIAAIKDPTEEQEVKNVAIRALGQIKDVRAINPLIEALDADDPSIGQHVAEVLIQFGQNAAAPMIAVLERASGPGQRTWAARILGRLQAQEAALALIAALEDHNEKVRQAAALALAAIKDKRAIGPLTTMLLNDPVALVREKAAQALGEMADESVIESLKAGLADLNYETRLAAMKALEGMKDKAAAIFFEVLDQPGKEGAAAAAAALERMGFVHQLIEELGQTEISEDDKAFNLLLKIAKTGVVETLAHNLRHQNALVRQHLCRILKLARHPRSLEALMQTAKDDLDPNVRAQALEALIAMGDPKTTPLLSLALKDEKIARANLLEALAFLPQQIKTALIPDLIALTHHLKISLRQAAVNALGFTAGDGVIDPLIASLKDAASAVRAEAAAALGRRHTASDDEAYQETAGKIVGALNGALDDPDKNVRACVVRSLRVYAHSLSILPLARAFEDADDTYKDDIAEALSEMAVKNFFELLDRALANGGPKTRAGIAWTLGLIGDERGLKILPIYLKDPEPLVRAAAAGALGQFRSPAVTPLLQEYLHDPNERVRAAVVNALGKSREFKAAPLLTAMLNDPDLFVQERAILAIGCLLLEKETHETVQARHEIKQWKTTHAPSAHAQMTATFALTLLQEKSTFAESLNALHEHEQRKLLISLLKTLPRDIRECFFKNLSLDSMLFFGEHADLLKTCRHYIRLLQSSRRPQERIQAIMALMALKAPEAQVHLTASFYKDPDENVRAQALLALAQTLALNELLEKIARAVKDPSATVKNQVPVILEKFNPRELERAKHLLIPLTETPHEPTRRQLARMLARLYRDECQDLAHALAKTADKNTILTLLEALGAIADPKAAAAFESHASSPDPEIRAAAAAGAAELGILPKDQLLQHLEDPQETVRVAVLKALNRQWDSSMLTALALRLEDPSARVRQELAALLGTQRTPQDERPLRMLQALMQDENLNVKIQSLLSLFRIGAPNALTQVTETLKKIDAAGRQELKARLEKQGLILTLTNTLKHNASWQQRKEAFQFLFHLDFNGFKKELMDACGDPASEMRLAAVAALSQSRDPDCQKAIEALEQDPVDAVRRAAAWARMRLE